MNKYPRVISGSETVSEARIKMSSFVISSSQACEKPAYHLISYPSVCVELSSSPVIEISAGFRRHVPALRIEIKMLLNVVGTWYSTTRQ